MGKACILLAFVMLALALFPKNEVSGASIENPLLKTEVEDERTDLDDLRGHDRRTEVEDERRDLEELRGHDRDRDMDYDYAFLNQPPFAGGFPRDLSAMRRHRRLMKRMRRHAQRGGEQLPVPPSKIPAGCCTCGDHYCCDSMCHGK